LHPGWGWLYLGRPRLAVAFAASWFATSVAELIAALWPSLIPPFFALAAIFYGFWVGQTIGAVAIAMLERQSFVLRPSNSARAYAAFLALIIVPSRVLAVVERLPLEHRDCYCS